MRRRLELLLILGGLQWAGLEYRLHDSFALGVSPLPKCMKALTMKASRVLSTPPLQGHPTR